MTKGTEKSVPFFVGFGTVYFTVYFFVKLNTHKSHNVHSTKTPKPLKMLDFKPFFEWSG